MTLLLSLLAFVLVTISVIGLIVLYKLFKDIEKNLKNNDKRIQNDYYFEKFFEMMNTIKHIDAILSKIHGQCVGHDVSNKYLHNINDKLDDIYNMINKHENQTKMLIEQNTSLKEIIFSMLKKEKSAGDEK